MAYRVCWRVGLSDGTNATEGKEQFEVREGELSPWRRLLAVCEERGVTITSLALVADGGKTVWSVPSAGKAPKFRAFAEAEKPVSYRFFRKMGADVIGEGEDAHLDRAETYAVIEAGYASGARLQLWVDEHTLSAWCLNA